jgi:hypothetical protein
MLALSAPSRPSDDDAVTIKLCFEPSRPSLRAIRLARAVSDVSRLSVGSGLVVHVASNLRNPSSSKSSELSISLPSTPNPPHGTSNPSHVQTGPTRSHDEQILDLPTPHPFSRLLISAKPLSFCALGACSFVFLPSILSSFLLFHIVSNNAYPSIRSFFHFNNFSIFSSEVFHCLTPSLPECI